MVPRDVLKEFLMGTYLVNCLRGAIYLDVSWPKKTLHFKSWLAVFAERTKSQWVQKKIRIPFQIGIKKKKRKRKPKTSFAFLKRKKFFIFFSWVRSRCLADVYASSFGCAIDLWRKRVQARTKKSKTQLWIFSKRWFLTQQKTLEMSICG